ncbi:MAG: phospholipid/cholesterol/gamma-HCH transport system substrate-binding protein [Actinomycetota bacterium]|jgi:phospholipid/cholesterol/gamma-HCH transport system substrate-binding protein
MSSVGIRNIRIGLLVMLLVGGTVWWRVQQPPPRQHFSAVISDASELVPDNSVRIKDVPVGQVTKVVLDGLHAKVSFNLDRDVHLPAGTRVELRQTSLLGEEYLALVPEGKGRLREGATIPIDKTRRVPQLEQVVELGGDLVNQVTADSLNRVINAFDEAAGGDPQRVARFIDAMAGATEAFAAHREDMATTIDRVHQMAAALAPHTDELAHSVDQFAAGLQALDRNKGQLAAFVESVDRLSTSAAELVTTHEAKLSTAGAKAKDLLTQIDENLPDFEKAVQALPDFNNGWACTVQGNFIQWLAAAYPEVARVDTGSGACTPAQGARGRQESGQVQVEGVPQQEIDDPAGTGDIDTGDGSANENRVDRNGRPYQGSSSAGSSNLASFMWWGVR